MLYRVDPRLLRELPPPTAGGDSIDWEELAQEHGLTLPADYRAFVEAYGGGEVDEYFSIRTPPVPGSGYGGLLDGLDPMIRPGDENVLAPYFPDNGSPLLLTIGETAHGDVMFWLRTGEPDAWKVATFKRQALYGENPWQVFDGGIVAFLLAAFDGSIDPFSAGGLSDSPHTFMTWRDIRYGD